MKMDIYMWITKRVLSCALFTIFHHPSSSSFLWLAVKFFSSPLFSSFFYQIIKRIWVLLQNKNSLGWEIEWETKRKKARARGKKINKQNKKGITRCRYKHIAWYYDKHSIKWTKLCHFLHIFFSLFSQFFFFVGINKRIFMV